MNIRVNYSYRESESTKNRRKREKLTDKDCNDHSAKNNDLWINRAKTSFFLLFKKNPQYCSLH